MALVTSLLREAYPDVPISNAQARRVVMAGQARVNGRAVARPGLPIGPGDRVTVAVDPLRLGRARRESVTRAGILFQDEHLVAVNKPAGLPTHATADPDRPHLVGEVARKLGIDASALGVHQRLDAGTSGVVLFGRTAEANRGLARAFAGRAVEKVYLAVADGRHRRDLAAGDSWTSRGALAESGAGRKGRRMRVAESGQAAETAFVVIARRGDRLLVDARPRTGRQHQIRAHLAAEQLPILGDTRYGGPPAARLHLHASRLELAHPVTGAWLRIEAPAPEDWSKGT